MEIKLDAERGWKQGDNAKRLKLFLFKDKRNLILESRNKNLRKLIADILERGIYETSESIDCDWIKMIRVRDWHSGETYRMHLVVKGGVKGVKGDIYVYRID